MKSRYQIILAIVLGAILPSIILRFYSSPQHKETRAVQTVYVLHGDQVEAIELESYLIGVVLAEMPADFEEEALKAQAVAARTFTLYRKAAQPKHESAEICTDPGCCQGYLPWEEYLANGGDLEDVNKISTCVVATKGEILCYNQEIIESTYFSASGGRTEDAKAVWGSDVPYLQSKESPGESQPEQIIRMSTEEFCQALRMEKNAVSIDKIVYTRGNGIAEASINGSVFTGLQLRRLLGLFSTDISFDIYGDVVEITAKGKGHRVGMSQYGADAMAMKGSTYSEILLHYFTGVTICSYDSLEN